MEHSEALSLTLFEVMLRVTYIEGHQGSDVNLLCLDNLHRAFPT
jgi:hypothetical protein